MPREHTASAADTALSGAQWLPRNNASRVCTQMPVPRGTRVSMQGPGGMRLSSKLQLPGKGPRIGPEKAVAAQLWPPSAQGPQRHTPGTFGARPSSLPLRLAQAAPAECLAAGGGSGGRGGRATEERVRAGGGPSAHPEISVRSRHDLSTWAWLLRRRRPSRVFRTTSIPARLASQSSALREDSPFYSSTGNRSGLAT